LPEVASDYLDQARQVVETRLTELYVALGDAGLTARQPEGGFYLWLDVASRIGSADPPVTTDWCIDLANRHGVGLWPGEDFGGPGWVRIAATAPTVAAWRGAVSQLATAILD
jgi:aspartate/methionine/tyrosine aminotransferase